MSTLCPHYSVTGGGGKVLKINIYKYEFSQSSELYGIDRVSVGGCDLVEYFMLGSLSSVRVQMRVLRSWCSFYGEEY